MTNYFKKVTVTNETNPKWKWEHNALKHIFTFFSFLISINQKTHKKSMLIFKILKIELKKVVKVNYLLLSKTSKLFRVKNSPFICRGLPTCPTWLFRNFGKWKSSSAIYLHEKHVRKNWNSKSHFALTGIRGCFIDFTWIVEILM